MPRPLWHLACRVGTVRTYQVHRKLTISHQSGCRANLSRSTLFAPAKTAFDEAREIFKEKLTRDPKKKHRIDSLHATGLRDVLDAVTTAQKHYENKHTNSEASRWIMELSRRLCHYGNIMDVLVQHHPEYVALAWGAIKLLFGVCISWTRRHTGTSLIMLRGYRRT